MKNATRKNATRSKRTEADRDDRATPAHGMDVAPVDAASRSFDPDPTEIIPQGILADLCTEAVRRDTVPPAGLYSEASLIEALAAAQSDVTESLTTKR